MSSKVDRYRSCRAGLNSPCGNEIWGPNPAWGFYTVCCNGDIMDITGFNSYKNYTLKLENLICCPFQKDNPVPPSEERKGCKKGLQERAARKGCKKGEGTPLSEFLSTSTEVAQSWSTELDGKATMMEPECFWSQLGVPTASWDSTASVTPWQPKTTIIIIGQTPTVFGSLTGSILPWISKAPGPAATAPTTSFDGIATTDASATSMSAPTSAGLAAVTLLPSWMLPVSLLLSIALSV